MRRQTSYNRLLAAGLSYQAEWVTSWADLYEQYLMCGVATYKLSLKPEQASSWALRESKTTTIIDIGEMYYCRLSN